MSIRNSLLYTASLLATVADGLETAIQALREREAPATDALATLRREKGNALDLLAKEVERARTAANNKSAMFFEGEAAKASVKAHVLSEKIQRNETALRAIRTNMAGLQARKDKALSDAQGMRDEAERLNVDSEGLPVLTEGVVL